MVEPGRGNSRPFDVPVLAAAYFTEGTGGGHHAHVHREVGIGELGLENAPQSVRPDAVRLKTVEMKPVLRLKEGAEKRYALDVVPVKMGHQDVRIEAEFLVRLCPAVSQH